MVVFYPILFILPSYLGCHGCSTTHSQSISTFQRWNIVPKNSSVQIELFSTTLRLADSLIIISRKDYSITTMEANS